MEVTFLRGATCIIELADKRILTDPWLEDGIYHGAWAHYPAFTARDWLMYEPSDVDYIYISHIHPDHFDPVTMSALQRGGCSAPVLIHKFPSPFLKKRIEELGYEVIELEPGIKFPLGMRGHLRIYPADACNPDACGKLFSCMPLVRSTQVDSLAVFHDGHRTLVNVNDCPWGLASEICRKIAGDYPQVDVALVAYGGAGPFPQCFQLTNEQKDRAARAKKRTFINAVAKFVNALNAQCVIPFAGDYQLCGSLSELNEYRGVPEHAEVYGALRSLGVPTIELAPGGSTSPAFSAVAAPNADERKYYVQQVLAPRKLDYEGRTDVPIEKLISLSVGAFERYDKKRRGYGLQVKGTIYIKLASDIYIEIPPVGEARVTETLDAENYTEIGCDPRLLEQLLTGPRYAHWNNAEIGSHLSFDRRGPYEPGLHHLMSFLHN